MNATNSDTRTISRLLIANRGEIAARIARTANAMGISTVAVYSDPDADSPVVRAADRAVRLPGTTSAQTYLDTALILDAARRSGADAIHPGYGFLSENPDFARAVINAGLTWVGPDPDQIVAMALKVEAKRIAEAAGVPLIPGAELDDDASAEQMQAAGAAVGFPLLVKASAGGGGKGMRLVERPEDLIESVAAAGREARSAFGDGTVFLERYLATARHVEVQVFGDRTGNAVHLFERECSIQRRHQKVVEEAPSPGASDTTRAGMFAAAVSLTKSIGYVGAGTVEFLVAGSGASQEFFFLEMNTRLQVEHPVTEMTTGLDLVEWQLRVARGEPLPAAQAEIQRSGHAIEVRLYAEDPASGYLPNTGRLSLCRWGAAPRIRVDSGILEGGEVTSLYDPMLAKVISYAPERTAAADSLAAYLESMTLLGVRTNRESLAAVLRENDFRAGATTTDYLDTHEDVLTPQLTQDQHRRALLAALFAHRRRAGQSRGNLVSPGWRNVPAVPEFERAQVQFAGTGQPQAIRWRYLDDGDLEVDVTSGDDVFTAAADDSFTARVRFGSQPDLVRISIDRVDAPAVVHLVDTTALVVVDGISVPVLLLPRFVDAALAGGAAGPSTPVPGTVTLVEVAVGDAVVAGQSLVVLEAMKMEHRITADADGIVEEILVSPGQSVDAHQVVAVLTGEGDDS